MILLSAVMIYVGPLAPFALAQFQWSQRIASIANLPSGILDIGLALDTNANCYVTGWFDGTNNFGGITLTNHSTGGGSDIFVAKYNSSGTLQWVQPAGQSAGNVNYGRAVGADTNGNIYVTGGYQGPATFGNTNLSATSGEQFFLAKYNAISGTNQWVKPSTGGNGNNSGIGLTVDGAGNCYALAVMDYVRAVGTSISFGSSSGSITVTNAKNGTTFLVLVKYDSTGTAQWAQLFDSSVETYGSKVAVDAAGNVYVRGTFTSDMTIGTSNPVVSAGSTKNMFIAKFNNSGVLVWVQQPIGGNVDEGGVAVDSAGNVFVSGAFDSNLNFGTNLNGTVIILTNMANGSASFGDAFLAKYNSAGVIQWAQAAGGANGGYYMDIALDAQTNIYAAGGLVSGAAVSKYSPAGTLQWTYAANGPPANPVGSVVAKCAVDAAGHCYVDGIYQGTTAFGTNTLLPQEAWNFFLAETVTNPTVQFTASPTSGLPPLTVQFNSTNVDSLGNTISSWKWNFGDGTTTNAQNPSHTYTNTGTFNPSFVATNNHNVAVIGYGPQIAVTNLIILFTAYPTNGLLPLAVQFNAYGVDSAGNNIISWNWNFGDGVTTNGQYPSHTYTNAGTFNPTLVATNNQRIAVIGFGPQITTLTSASPTNLTYTITNGTVTITGYIGSGGGVVNIPPTINGYPVIGIGANAFFDCYSLTSITIPNNVTNIGSGAFMNCTNLTSAAIQGGAIGGSAFYGCYSLTNVTLGTNVTSIGAYAFSGGYYYGNTLYGGGDPLSSITIPNSVTNIGAYAFYDCTNLTSAAIQGGGTIGDYAFNDCYSLTNVTLGTNVTSIGAYAFSGYYYNMYYTLCYEGDPLSSITIPNNVTSIGTNAFYYCTNLTNATIQGGTIGEYAFYACFNQRHAWNQCHQHRSVCILWRLLRWGSIVKHHNSQQRHQHR
jgi:PKD repeat protein